MINVEIVSAEIKSFREACCLKLGIREEDFGKTVLLACLPLWHLPVGHLRWRFTRKYFHPDLELIRQAGDCTTTKDIISKICNNRYHNRENGFQRRFLRARLSGNRLIKFASQFLPS